MTDRAMLRATLDAPSWSLLTLPAELEQAYREYHQSVALDHIRSYWPIVAGTLAIIGVLLFFSELVTPSTRGLVLFGLGLMYALTGLAVLVASVTSFNSQLNLVMGIVATMALLAMHVSTVLVLPGNPLQVIAQFGVILVAVAVFSISNLLFRQAAACVLLATLGFLSLVLSAHLRIDWAAVAIYTMGSALVGATIGFSQEIRERTVFLQGRLLLLEKKEIDSLARELALLSRVDALTGLFNRRSFDEALLREWSTALRERGREPIGLLFIDVDYFKHFNDRYGHQAGDACLARVGTVLAQQSTRAADLLARYGGEEFVGLFPRTGKDGLVVIANRIIEAVDALAIPHESSLVAPQVTVSIGVAVLEPEAGLSPQELVRLADAALYAAKSRGRHQCVMAWADTLPP